MHSLSGIVENTKVTASLSLRLLLEYLHINVMTLEPGENSKANTPCGQRDSPGKSGIGVHNINVVREWYRDAMFRRAKFTWLDDSAKIPGIGKEALRHLVIRASRSAETLSRDVSTLLRNI